MSDGEPQPAETEPTGWRDDPRWRLVWYSAEFYSEADAPEQPPREAEIAQPPIWASLFRAGRIVATWYRPTVRRDESSGRG